MSIAEKVLGVADPYRFNFDWSKLQQGLGFDQFRGMLPSQQLDAMQRVLGGDPYKSAYGAYQKYWSGQPSQQSSDPFYKTELPDPTKYFDPAMLNKFFDTARGNLGQQQASTAANAARRAGASSAGFLNPASFVNMASTQATAPYAEQFGRLETGRAQGQMSLQQLLYQMLAQKASAERGGEDAQRDYMLRLKQLEEQKRQFDVSSEIGWEDIFAMLFGAGGQIGAAALTGTPSVPGKP